MNTQKYIKEYIRETPKGHPIGVVVAIKVGDKAKLGFSLCSPRDKFDRKFGDQIAINRALSDSYRLPESGYKKQLVLDRIESVGHRARDYFKTEVE